MPNPNSFYYNLSLCILFILRRKGNYLIIFILLIRVPHFWNTVIYSVSYTVAKKKKNLTVLCTGQTLTTYVFIFYWIYTVIFPLKSSRFYDRTFKQQTLFQHNEPDSFSYRKQNIIISLARKGSLTRNKPSPIYEGKMPKEGTASENKHRTRSRARGDSQHGNAEKASAFWERDAPALLPQKLVCCHEHRKECGWGPVVGRSRNGRGREDHRNSGVGRLATQYVVCVRSAAQSQVWLLATPRTVAHEAPLSMGVFRQEHWSGHSVKTTNRREAGVAGEWRPTFHGKPGSRGLWEILTLTSVLPLAVA